jgi:endonuclease-3
MPRPLPAAAQRMPKILEALARAYPDAACTLNYSNPLELLVATILSAQCTDVLVNKVTPALFKKYRTARHYAQAKPSVLERDLARVNFYRNKARSIRGACRLIAERFGGRVPDRMEDLLTLPGVARKTANVILGNAFGAQEGIVVDTHVMRLSERLALSAQKDRDKIEQDLIALVPKHAWTKFGHQMILHGRTVCTAKAPKCAPCPIGEALCPSYQAT